MEDGVQLLRFGQVDPHFLLVHPVWQSHMHSYEVFQVHAQDGESKSRALGEPLAVLGIVPTGRHQFDEVVEDLRV